MSCRCHETTAGRIRGLYRDKENGIFMGVCSGVAHFFDVQSFAVRVVTLISLLIFTMPTLFAYFVAGFLLKERSLSVCNCRDERDFWRSGRDYGA
ncbi:MAG: PspC domain-containing protein [Pseudomonadota bacterium]